jgi:hypothetical protein
MKITSHIWNLIFLNNFRWRNDQYKSCGSWKVMQLSDWEFFIWNCLSKENCGRIFSHLKFKFFKRPRREKWPKPKLWRSQKVIKLCSWKLFHLNLLVSWIFVLKPDKDRKRRMNIPNGHNRLTGIVVRGRTREVWDRVFECCWPQVREKSLEKSSDCVDSWWGLS